MKFNGPSSNNIIIAVETDDGILTRYTGNSQLSLNALLDKARLSAYHWQKHLNEDTKLQPYYRDTGKPFQL